MAQRTLYGSKSWGSDTSGNWDDAGTTNGVDVQWWSDGFGGDIPQSPPVDEDIAFTDGTFTTGPTVAVDLYSFDNSALSGSDSMDYANISVSHSLLIIQASSWVSDIADGVTATFVDSNDQGDISGGTVSFESNAGAAVLSGNITGGRVSFVGPVSGVQAVISGGKVSFDANSLYFTVSVLLGGYSPLWSDCILSLDGGTNWFVHTGLLPSADKVALTAPVTDTYNTSGDAVAGTLGSGLNGNPLLGAL